MPTYDDLDEKYEYLDLSGKNMMIQEIKDVLEDLVEDSMIKHINLSRNVSREDASDPNLMGSLFESLTNALLNNDCLIALDWAGNYIGDFGPHPPNDHMIDYVVVLADALSKSTVRRVDLSDNCLTGPSYRKLSGLSRLVKHCIPYKFEVLRLRNNGINSLAVGLLSKALGLESTLQEIDLSYNMIGKDALGRHNSEGIVAIGANLAQTHSLKRLYLAGNYLQDEEIVELCGALCRLPNLSLLDISNNQCRGVGTEALRELMHGHGSFSKVRYGVTCILYFRDT
jgi:Ran GTPase-activating protein (RanGAP) involved in mRNA processing and transport